MLPTAHSHSVQQDRGPFGLGTSRKQPGSRFVPSQIFQVYISQRKPLLESCDQQKVGPVLWTGEQWRGSGIWERVPTPVSAVHKLVTTACAISPQLLSLKKYKDNFQRGNFPLSMYSHGKMQHDFLFLVSVKITLWGST